MVHAFMFVYFLLSCMFFVFFACLRLFVRDTHNAPVDPVASRLSSSIASGGTRLGAQVLGTHQHTFCSHLKTRFKQKFRPNHA